MTPTSTSRSESSGFTLIEILIAISILAFLSLAVALTTVNTFDLNRKLAATALDSTSILLSLQAVEQDLAQIYSPNLAAAPARPDDRKSEFWGPAVRSDGFRRSRFKGSAEKISFVANNHRRVEADTPESDLQSITWELERNKSGSYSLYRSSDWDTFRYEENPKKSPKVALLENLSAAKFQFFKRFDKKWEDSWDSEDSYVKEESRFPDLIRLRIEAPDPTNNSVQRAWEIIVRPNMPLNYLDAKKRAELKERFTE